MQERKVKLILFGKAKDVFQELAKLAELEKHGIGWQYGVYACDFCVN